MHTEKEILAACVAHGAKRVYDAAMARFSGDEKKLSAVGLAAADVAEANAIGNVAFAMMNTSERAADLADASIKGASL